MKLTAKSGDIPDIQFGALPDAEVPAAFSIQSALSEMVGYTEAVAHAIELTKFATREIVNAIELPKSDARKQTIILLCGWKAIAARDVAINLNNMLEAMEGVRDVFNQAPTFKGLIEWDKMIAAINGYKAEFPNMGEARHAVAHSAGTTKSPKQFNKNKTRDRHLESTILTASRSR